MASLERGGIVRETTTESNGVYQFDKLPVGVYRLDFDLTNFDIVRRNRVSVGGGTTERIDVAMKISSMCECVEVNPRRDLRERVGTVVTGANDALPHAQLEIATSTTKERAYADREGRFRVLVPTGQRWRLTVSDSGFGSVTQSISGNESTSLIIRLPAAGSASMPATEEFRRGCRCPGDLFRHRGR
jgi:hypothetical protein